MDNSSSQPNSFHPYSDSAKRVACIRCRTQKLKCIKSTHSADSSDCDRCRKADVACVYVPSKPMGRPRISRPRQTTRTMRCTASQPKELLDDIIDLNTMPEDTCEAFDVHNITMFFDNDIPRDDPSDASTGQDFAFSAHEMDFLTPCSSQGTGAIFNSSDTYIATVPVEDDETIHPIRSPNADHGGQGPQTSMQYLAKIGLDLHEQTLRYQESGDSIALQDLVSDVVRSSTEYLECLLSLDETFVSRQSTSSSRFGSARADTQPYYETMQQLDMSAAFQLLIPYVRLVQLHNILYRSMLRCLSVGGSGSGSGRGSSDTLTAPPRSNIPVVTVGGVRVNASDPFRARMLLHINIDLLAEIETALDLPHEARVCCPQADSGVGINGDMGLVVNAQGTSGLLHKAVSPRLLRTILEERNVGTDGIQSMRDCIARIKCLLRSSRHR